MTVCIAAICDLKDVPTIVFCADRLVTAETQFEHGSPKVRYLTPNCLIMIAGDVLQGEIVLKSTIERITKLEEGDRTSITKLVNMLSEEYKKLLNINIETDILNSLGLTIEYFPDKVKQLPDWMGINIMSRIEEYDLGLEFLVFGLETKDLVAHLYRIGEKGKIDCYDYIGFASTGSGRSLAYSEMTKFSYSPHIDLSETIYRIFVAKKVAERVQGVGKDTDLGILYFNEDKETKIIDTKVWMGSVELMEVLKSSYEEQKTKEVQLVLKFIENVKKTLFDEEKQNSEKK